MVRRKRALDGLGQDIRDHIERETQDNIDKGMAPEEARRQALIRFGNVALTMEDTQAVWGWPSLDQIREDLRYVLRVLRRKPAFRSSPRIASRNFLGMLLVSAMWATSAD